MPMKITENSRKVLDALRRSGVTRGFELRHMASLSTSQDLAEAVRPLLQANLVTASGSLDPTSVESTQFAPLAQAFTSSNVIIEP